jgi:hypothetical protein
MFTLFKKSPKYEIVETRNFSCEGMKGFTFTYPVFKGYEVGDVSPVKDEKDSCIINFKALPPSAIRTEVKVKKIDFDPHNFKSETKENGNYIMRGLPYNPKGIKYLYRNESPDNIKFDISGGKGIMIEFVSFGNFPDEQFFKTVIESFTITK